MKLNLRDLFWLILATALCLAWFLDRRALSIDHRQALLSQRDTLIRAFVKERNDKHREGMRLIFMHPDEPHPNDPNVSAVPELTIAAP
ncbi:hypothetical protein NA78x_000362 [Anatilimnocola sp. NA78]|uniref:hypothetical protein n=1 Tax=Anatilimnocola sp. NA78 TaxID=3415683 RepID=UPI003CE4EC68